MTTPAPGPKDLARLFQGALTFELDRSSLQDPVAIATPKGARLLHGDSPRMLLDRIADGDPLDVLGRTNRRLKFQAILMDWHRVTRRSMTYVAYFAAHDGYRGDPPLDEFICRAIDEAIESLIEEDWSAERRDDPIDPETDPFGSIALAGDMSPAQARRVTLEFNLQPLCHRRPLYAVLVENVPFAEAAEKFGLGTAELEALVRTTLGNMLRVDSASVALEDLLEDLEGDES